MQLKPRSTKVSSRVEESGASTVQPKTLPPKTRWNNGDVCRTQGSGLHLADPLHHWIAIRAVGLCEIPFFRGVRLFKKKVPRFDITHGTSVVFVFDDRYWTLTVMVLLLRSN